MSQGRIAQKRYSRSDGLQALLANRVWALDFAVDFTTDARKLNALYFSHKFTNTALAIGIKRSMTGDHIVRILKSLADAYGQPTLIPAGKRPATTRHANVDCCRSTLNASVFIKLSGPWQNALVESFNGALRDELLTIRVLHRWIEAKTMAEDYRVQSNTIRPYSSRCYRRPHESTLDLPVGTVKSSMGRPYDMGTRKVVVVLHKVACWPTSSLWAL